MGPFILDFTNKGNEQVALSPHLSSSRMVKVVISVPAALMSSPKTTNIAAGSTSVSTKNEATPNRPPEVEIDDLSIETRFQFVGCPHQQTLPISFYHGRHPHRGVYFHFRSNFSLAVSTVDKLDHMRITFYNLRGLGFGVWGLGFGVW